MSHILYHNNIENSLFCEAFSQTLAPFKYLAILFAIVKALSVALNRKELSPITP